MEQTDYVNFTCPPLTIGNVIVVQKTGSGQLAFQEIKIDFGPKLREYILHIVLRDFIQGSFLTYSSKS